MSKVISLERIKTGEKLNSIAGVTLDDLIAMLVETAGVGYAKHIVHDVIEDALKTDDVFWGLINSETERITSPGILLKMYLLGIIHAKKGV